MTKTINVGDPVTFIDRTDVQRAGLVQLVNGPNTYDDTGTTPLLNLAIINPDPNAVGPDGRRIENETGVPHQPSGASTVTGPAWLQP
jgi:hypothetical protein